jgi:hypothetical protein
MKPHLTFIREYWWRVEFPSGRRIITFGFKLACQLAVYQSDGLPHGLGLPKRRRLRRTFPGTEESHPSEDLSAGW